MSMKNEANRENKVICDVLGKLFRKNHKPNFWEIRQTFIDYVELESDILQVSDFDKDRHNGNFIGYNPNDCSNPTSFLSAGFKDAHKSLKNVTLYAAWMTRGNSSIVKSHYEPLELHKKEIDNLF